MAFRILLLLLLMVSSASAGIVLDATTDSLEVVTTSTAAIDYDCNWTDNTTSAFTPGDSTGQITTATTTTVVAAPASSTQRNIQNCTFRNAGTVNNTLTIQKDANGSNRTKYSATLAASESIRLDQSGTFSVVNAGGSLRTQSAVDSGYNGKTYAWQKVGTAKDSAGYWYSYQKDAGFPGASVLGAPGLNGWTTDCSTATNAAEPAGAAQVGAHLLQDPATGNLYLTEVRIAGSVAETVHLIDVLWYNTGLAVTTTTAQSITFPGGGLPARDINGSSNGEGVQLALLTTTANTNAAVIATTTASYTDSDGNAGNTATFSGLVGWQAPATPVIGTWMPFQLAAGDRGMRAVASITLGTSYGAGALSAVLFRPLVTISNTVANAAGVISLPAPGIRIHPNSCIMAIAVGSASASTLAGSYTIMER